jgi:hypothetical protein
MMEKIPHRAASRSSVQGMDDAPDTTPPRAPEPEGGESACFAHLVCEECGALEHEGHHDGCSSARVEGSR